MFEVSMHRAASAELQKLCEYLAALRDCLIDAQVAKLRGPRACRPSKAVARLRNDKVKTCTSRKSAPHPGEIEVQGLDSVPGASDHAQCE
jgi:hypothetical protein